MKEKSAWKLNGFVGLLLVMVLGFVGLVVLGTGGPGGLFFVVAVILLTGIDVVPPNQGHVVIFFGKYLGTIRDNGFFFTVPFSTRRNISLKVRNFSSQKAKVNDINGNPIEIAAVVVYKVVDSAKALFDVDQYEEFVEIQSETAIRHIATKYPYDNFEEETLTLRGNAQEVSDELTKELQERLNVAGVEVLEARLTHLAYSTEIAQAMLQRQQATAIIAARQKIVEGAVGMAKLAIEELEKDGTLDLDGKQRVQLVNNLLVSVVSEQPSQPVINTGSL